MRVVLTREVSADLENALSRIAANNPAASAGVATRMDRTLAISGDFPRTGGLDPDTGARE
jgi:hypothetical protein